MNEPTHLDLFSGIGGFALAAQWAGFRTVAFCEIEPYCQAVLKARFGAVMADAADNGRADSSSSGNDQREQSENSQQQRCGRNGGIARHVGAPSIFGDIRSLDGTRYRGADLLTGGFPCQPFSVAGKRAGAADDRFLWPEMLRVVSEARPAWIVGENVAGIVNMELDRVLSDLENIGYAVWPLVIPACAVDARHRRDRVWIVANAGSGGWQSGSAGWRGTIGSGTCDEFSEPGKDSESLAHSIGAGLEIEQCESGNDGGQQPTVERSCDQWERWLPEPNVGRVAHGVSKRVDRLKGLGNAIVPQVAFQILKAIRELIA